MKTLTAFMLLIFSAAAATVPVSQKTLKGKTVNSCSGAQIFRLVYASGKVLSEFQTSGTTQTINSLYCATTQAEIDAQVQTLKLTKTTPATAAPAAKSASKAK